VGWDDVVTVSHEGPPDFWLVCVLCCHFAFQVDLHLEGWIMKKIILLVFVLGVFFPAALLAQNLSPGLMPTGLPSLPSMGEDSATGSFLSNLPLVQELKAGKIVLNPYVQIGYQHIGANMTIPISSDTGTPVGQLQVGTVDVSLKNFNFWSGTVGLNVVAAPFTLFGSATGFAPHIFQLSGQLPISLGPLGAAPEFEMTATNFQFWAVQGGAGYEFKKGYSILGGFMWSHMTVEFESPRTASGPIQNQTIQGDVLLKIGVPFLGVQVMQQGYYRAALLYSPLALSQGTLAFSSSQQTLANLSYSLNQPGQFWAVSAEYYFLFKPPVMLSMWFNGSLVNIKGSSDLEFTAAGPAVFRTRDVTITNTQYLMGGGITFGLAF
jgi:hypothetical protein